jgi:hypothetical protein
MIPVALTIPAGSNTASFGFSPVGSKTGSGSFALYTDAYF